MPLSAATAMPQADLEDLKKRLKEAETQDAELKRHVAGHVFLIVAGHVFLIPQSYKHQKRSRGFKKCFVSSSYVPDNPRSLRLLDCIYQSILYDL